MTRTEAEQIFGARIEVIHDPVGIYADDSRRDAAEDVSGLWCCTRGRVGRETTAYGLTTGFVPSADC